MLYSLFRFRQYLIIAGSCVLLLAMTLFLKVPKTVFMQASPVPAQGNPIQQENQRPGTTAWQWTNPAAYNTGTFRFPDIEGYAWTTSALAGETLSFSVSTTSKTFTAAIYRLGWYQGKGGRLLRTLSAIPGHFYAMPALDPHTGLVDANWPVAFTLRVDPSWVTGLYLVKLTASNGKDGYIPFVVRSQRTAAFALIHASNTDQAYNPWGGKSLYEFRSSGGVRAYKVSYNRPLADAQLPGFGNLLHWEYPMIRYLERQGYDLEYLSDVDTDTHPELLVGPKGILLVGHSEYWAKAMRDHLEAAVSRGVNLANFAANSIYWQIRYEPSLSNHLPNRIIVCYKEADLDPLTGKDNSEVTVQFREAPVNRPEQALLGSMYESDFAYATTYPWVVSDASSWVFSGTGLKNGNRFPGLVGYEYDKVLSGYSTPSGDRVIATSPIIDTDGKKSVSNSTLYTAPSGARVFNAGTMEWSWGLDPFNLADNHANAVNPTVQKITQNILQNFLTVRGSAHRLG